MITLPQWLERFVREGASEPWEVAQRERDKVIAKLPGECQGRRAWDEPTARRMAASEWDKPEIDRSQWRDRETYIEERVPTLLNRAH